MRSKFLFFAAKSVEENHKIIKQVVIAHTNQCK